MIQFLIIIEVLAVFALIMFNGILDSKYYERLEIKTFSDLVWYPAYFLVIAVVLTALNDSGVFWEYLEAAVIISHTSLHFVISMLLIMAVTKFADVPFKYSRQYLFARGALYFAVVLEVLAVSLFVVCCVQQIF